MSLEPWTVKGVLDFVVTDDQMPLGFCVRDSALISGVRLALNSQFFCVCFGLLTFA